MLRLEGFKASTSQSMVIDHKLSRYKPGQSYLQKILITEELNYRKSFTLSETAVIPNKSSQNDMN